MPFDAPCTEIELAMLCDHFVGSGVVALVDRGARRCESHVGALLADCVLQAGLSYRHVVQPRVARVKSLFPYATRVSIFADVLDDVGAEHVLQWTHAEKPRRLDCIVTVLMCEGVETTYDLGRWLDDGSGRAILRTVKGVGPKTLDYMQILCGTPTCAIDRHVVAFMESAGVVPRDYDHAHAIFTHCAAVLSVPADQLDSALWRHQSGASVQLTF